MANPYGKSRKTENPYAIYKNGDWEYRILKVNQAPENAAKNQYASAFCAVKSPMTFGSFDLGDTYLNDISGVLVSGPDILKECGRR